VGRCLFTALYGMLYLLVLRHKTKDVPIEREGGVASINVENFLVPDAKINVYLTHRSCIIVSQ